MHARTLQAKFLAVLRIELEDLEQDLDGLIGAYQEKLQQHAETEHVCFENAAVLKNEEFGVRHFLRVLDRTRPEDYAGLDALIGDLRARFAAEIRHAGLASGALAYAERRIAKVRRYVTDCAEWAAEHGARVYAA
jgi:hypothetical protein